MAMQGSEAMATRDTRRRWKPNPKTRAKIREAKLLGVYRKPETQMGQPRIAKQPGRNPFPWQKRPGLFPWQMRRGTFPGQNGGPIPWQERGEKSHADAVAKLKGERVAAEGEVSKGGEARRIDADGTEAEAVQEGSNEDVLAGADGAEDESTWEDVADVEGVVERLRKLAEQLVVISTEVQHIAIQLGAPKGG